MAGRGGERRQHRQRFEPQRVGRMRGSVRVEVVAHEDQIELAALCGTADLLNGRKILKTVHRARIAPARDVAASAQDKEAEMHLSFHRIMSKTGFCVRGSRSVRRRSGW